MSIMTEEEMDYQIELNEIHSDKNDCAGNLYEFTESELSVHNERIRADERKKILDEVYVIALNESYDTLIEWLQDNIID